MYSSRSPAPRRRPRTILVSSRFHWAASPRCTRRTFLKRLRLFVFWPGEIPFVLLVASEHAIVMVELEMVLSAG